mmetsp:Transcript_20060/g.46543  ORF Transcript_20060/g.46543 Transcript_20060/m.46543 type:complete len:103 (-) Transcript_20060:856-1164(-)
METPEHKEGAAKASLPESKVPLWVENAEDSPIEVNSLAKHWLRQSMTLLKSNQTRQASAPESHPDNQGIRKQWHYALCFRLLNSRTENRDPAFGQDFYLLKF